MIYETNQRKFVGWGQGTLYHFVVLPCFSFG